MAAETAGTARVVVTLQRQIEELLKLPTTELQEAWTVAWGAPPPKGARRRFLMLGIAWRWQAAVLGGPPRTLERRLAALESTYRSGQKIEPGRQVTARPLLPGTRLVTAAAHSVTNPPDSFAHQSATYSPPPSATVALKAP